jgi:hypothetical protein
VEFIVIPVKFLKKFQFLEFFIFPHTTEKLSKNNSIFWNFLWKKIRKIKEFLMEKILENYGIYYGKIFLNILKKI